MVFLLASSRPAHPEVSLSSDPSGLASLTYNGKQYLAKSTACFMLKITFDRGGSKIPGIAGQVAPTVRTMANRVTISRDYPWGRLDCTYSTEGDKLLAGVTVTNQSPETLGEAQIVFVGLAPPRAPVTRMPLVDHNLGGPDIVFATYGSAKLYVANEEVAKMLVLTPRQSPKGLGILLETAYHKTLPALFPLTPQRPELVTRSIPAGGSDHYSLSVRFAPEASQPQVVMADLFQRWAARYPFTVNWPDRRPIGMLILSNGGGRLSAPNPKNPRHWSFLDPRVDINSPRGREEFKNRVLRIADANVASLKQMNAQGVIVWDVEGSEFRLQYVGDPRHLAPEMQDVVDEFFTRFRRAGLRCGLTLAVRKLMSPDALDENFQLTSQTTRRYLDNPNEMFQLLDPIVKYARQRWGCTLFYVDADGLPGQPSDVTVFSRLAAANPKVLIAPEHKTLTYYASTAPYCDSTLGVCPSVQARWIYPEAFGVVRVYQAPPSRRAAATPAEVAGLLHHGDILMAQSWLGPQHQDMKLFFDIEQQTRGSPSAP
jgi:hypothetical protein